MRGTAIPARCRRLHPPLLPAVIHALRSPQQTLLHTSVAAVAVSAVSAWELAPFPVVAVAWQQCPALLLLPAVATVAAECYDHRHHDQTA